MRLLLLALLTACTSAPIARGPSSVEADAFVLELERLFAPHVAALDRDMLLFRYESDGDFRKLGEVQAREIPTARRFFEPNRRGDPGLVTVTDPFATIAEGFYSPRLLAFRARAGARALTGDVDIVTDDERSAFGRLANEHGCGNLGDLPTFAAAANGFRNSPDIACRRALTEAFTRLRVQLILFSHTGVALAGCRTTGTGVNVIDPFALALEDINVYAPGRRLEGNPEFTPGIAALFAEAREDWRTRLRMGGRNPAEIFRDVTPLASPREWKNKYVFKCGARWSAEVEHPLAALMENARLNGDPEVRHNLLATAAAYAKRFPGIPFEPTRLRAVHEAVAQDLDVPAEGRAAWVVAASHAPDRLAGFAQTLDGKRGLAGQSAEGARHPSALPALYASFRDTLAGLSFKDQRDPMLFARLLAASGLGPVGQRVLYNNWQLDTGGVPVLKGDVSVDEEEARGSRTRDRELYLAILAKCRLVYERSSPSEITRGECGLVSIRE